MRRSLLLQVTVHCPHFERPVVAQMNAAIERLVACADSDKCRDDAPATESHEHPRPFPRGCPVFPAQAK
jgi:hypothetical protein